jgi:hypothetical protein
VAWGEPAVVKDEDRQIAAFQSLQMRCKDFDTLTTRPPGKAKRVEEE